MCYCQNFFFHWENWQRVTDGTSKHFWLKTFPACAKHRQAGQCPITASLACPSPRPLVPLSSQTLLTPDADTAGTWHRVLKAQRGGMHSKWEENATAGWSSFEISQPFSQLTAGLHSTQCRILHYLFDLIYSLKFIMHQCLSYNLFQGHIHESCIQMTHVHPYSQNSKLCS